MHINEKTSTAVDQFQRPMTVVARDVIHFTAVIARDHNLVAMATNPRVVEPRDVSTTVNYATNTHNKII